MNKNQATTLFKVSQLQFPLLAFSIEAHKPQEGGIIFPHVGGCLGKTGWVRINPFNSTLPPVSPPPPSPTTFLVDFFSMFI